LTIRKVSFIRVIVNNYIRKEMIKLIKNILGVDKEAEKVNARVNRIEKALTELEYKVADINVIVTFLNELRKEKNNENK
jgi:hypothetical protein